MADYNVPVEEAEKYQKWSGYFLVDIRIIFIITYVYISAVEMISATASNEANRDMQTPVHFNVTSRPEHTNVAVNYIDDAVLWNCREHSVTSNYYVTLYWMLLSVFMATLLFYTVSKCFALWSITSLNSLTDLWRLAIMKQLKRPMEKATYSSDSAEWLAQCYRDLLKEIPECVYNKVRKLSLVKRRKSIAYWSLTALVLALAFSILSYDLHPLSCVSGIPEDTINYDDTTRTVELRLPGSVVTFRRVGVFIVLFLIIALVLFAWWFYRVTRQIVYIMEVKVEKAIKTKGQQFMMESAI